MSSKSTPVNARINKLLLGSAPKSVSTPNSLHKRIARPLFPSKQADNLPNDQNVISSTPFLPTSAAKTPASTQKYKARTCTTLNACYTPSSLYRSSKNTPQSAFATPRSAAKHSTSTPDCSIKALNSSRRSEKSLMESSGLLSKSIKDVEISNLTVAVRVRPLNAQECTNPGVTNIVQVAGNEVTVYTGTTADNSAGVSHSFQYDQAFYSCDVDSSDYANQETVFEGTGMALIDRAFEGYNACLFAYGQTGSGKSYSMMGIEVDDSDDIATNTEAGIIPRFCHELFRRIEASKDKIHAEIEVSYFEIYNEKIHDLLCVSGGNTESNSCSSTHKNALKVREHPIWGPYVVDLSIQPVESYTALRNWLTVGNSQRATAATGMNDKSSRSHSIFNIVLNLSETDASDRDGEDGKVKQTRRSKISLVDLAGSERITHNGSNSDRVREGVSINKSLLTLGKVISKLADSKNKSNFVPYRESVLTWLLRESLGGNSKTMMLATISPASVHLDETVATLRYACQARTIVNRVKVNEDPHDKIIRELRAEVERLQALRQDYERQKRHSATGNVAPRKIIIETSVDESEVEALRQQLAETEKQLNKAQKSWMERLKEAENQRKSEVRLLKRKGLAMELSAEQKQACLVNLAADPILSGTLFYILPAGVVKIGRTRTSVYCSQPDIVLDGPLVGYHHCTIENTNGKLYITPDNEEFETYLNGELVLERHQMFHGDRLVIGGSHYFRISNPFCNKRRSKNVVVDFQLAHQEILHKQEEQLRRELDEEKRVALSQIEVERAANERNYKERMDMLELEQFKFKCNKEILETEKKALEEKSEDTFEYTPSYKSTLLDDINRIMQHPSEESLHKTQLMVKEATQRCRNLGLQLDFKQSQMLDEFGIFRAVVVILDRENRQKAEWPTARLDVWLDMVRDNEVSPNEIFKCVDIEWTPIDENLDETLSDSLNSSRISLNLSLVKEVMLKQPFQKFQNIFSSNGSNKKENLSKSAVLNCSMRNTKKMLIYDEEDNTPGDEKASPSAELDFGASASICVRDIHRSTLKLKKLCDRYSANENNSQDISQVSKVMQMRKSIEQLESVLHGLRATLSDNIFAETSPTKTPKSVRFLLD